MSLFYPIKVIDGTTVSQIGIEADSKEEALELARDLFAETPVQVELGEGAPLEMFWAKAELEAGQGIPPWTSLVHVDAPN